MRPRMSLQLQLSSKPCLYQQPVLQSLRLSQHLWTQCPVQCLRSQSCLLVPSRPDWRPKAWMSPPSADLLLADPVPQGLQVRWRHLCGNLLLLKRQLSLERGLREGLLQTSLQQCCGLLGGVHLQGPFLRCRVLLGLPVWVWRGVHQLAVLQPLPHLLLWRVC